MCAPPAVHFCSTPVVGFVQPLLLFCVEPLLLTSAVVLSSTSTVFFVFNLCRPFVLNRCRPLVFNLCRPFFVCNHCRFFRSGHRCTWTFLAVRRKRPWPTVPSSLAVLMRPARCPLRVFRRRSTKPWLPLLTGGELCVLGSRLCPVKVSRAQPHGEHVDRCNECRRTPVIPGSCLALRRKDLRALFLSVGNNTL